MKIEAIGIWYISNVFPSGYMHKILPYGEHGEYIDKEHAVSEAESYIKKFPLLDGKTCLVECEIAI